METKIVNYYKFTGIADFIHDRLNRQRGREEYSNVAVTSSYLSATQIRLSEVLNNFSRKRNMRERCRTQHGFDPMPKNVKQNLSTVGQGQFFFGTGAARLSDAGEKFMNLISERLTIEELGRNQNVHQLTRDSFGLMDNALNYLMDNYVIMRNTEVNGISGHPLILSLFLSNNPRILSFLDCLHTFNLPLPTGRVR